MFDKLVGLQYKIVYRKGSKNGAADALSRCPLAQVTAVSVCQPQWFEEVIASYAQDASAQELITKLTVQANAVPHFTLRDGVLRYKNRIWVGQDTEFKLKLISAVHTSPNDGHSGIAVIYR